MEPTIPVEGKGAALASAVRTPPPPASPDSLAGPSHVLESQLRECFGRVAYSHKTHEKCADIALRRLSLIKVFQIVLSAVTTGGLLAVLFGPIDKTRAAAALARL